MFEIEKTFGNGIYGPNFNWIIPCITFQFNWNGIVKKIRLLKPIGKDELGYWRSMTKSGYLTYIKWLN